MKRIMLMALLGLAACGELSNDDLVFLRGVPSKEELSLDVAPAGNGNALMAVVGQEAEFYADAYAISEETNGNVASILDFVDSIGNDAPPTTRERDRRVWGPFDDGERRTIRFEVRREGTSFRYCLHVGRSEQVTGEPTCDDIPGAFGMNAILYGTYTPRFSGGVAESDGEVTFDFEAAVQRPFGEERGKLVITHAYGDDGAAKTITVSAERPQIGLQPAATIAYSYDRDVDGRVLFALDLPGQFIDATPIPENLQIDACWREGGTGRADVVISGGDLTGRSPATAVECWGATHLRTYASFTIPDFPNYDISEGDVAACPPQRCD